MLAVEGTGLLGSSRAWKLLTAVPSRGAPVTTAGTLFRAQRIWFFRFRSWGRGCEDLCPQPKEHPEHCCGDANGPWPTTQPLTVYAFCGAECSLHRKASPAEHGRVDGGPVHTSPSSWAVRAEITSAGLTHKAGHRNKARPTVRTSRWPSKTFIGWFFPEREMQADRAVGRHGFQVPTPGGTSCGQDAVCWVHVTSPGARS